MNPADTYPQLETHQLTTQHALQTLKNKLDGLTVSDSPFQRIASSASIRSLSPTDILSTSPPLATSPPKALNGNGTPSSISFAKKSIPPSPSVKASDFSLPADKKEEVVSGRERGSFSAEQTRGNWGNRIVLTTYPGQANVGMASLSSKLIADPFPLDWDNPDPHLRGPSMSRVNGGNW